MTTMATVKKETRSLVTSSFTLSSMVLYFEPCIACEEASQAQPSEPLKGKREARALALHCQFLNSRNLHNALLLKFNL